MGEQQKITYRVELPANGSPAVPLPIPEKKRMGRPPKPKPVEAPVSLDMKFEELGTKKVELTDNQKKIDACDKRFIFVQAGRRFGKTTYSQYWLTKNAYSKPNSIWWYVAPTFKAAKELMWQPLMRDIPREDILKVNKTMCDITLKNGSMICIRGSDREDNLRGRRDGIDGAAIEEFSFHKAGVWELIIRPQLTDRKGKALFIGTPSMKKGAQYRMLSEYAKSGKDAEWGYFHFCIYDNPHIDPREIEQLKVATTDSAWKQEYLAEFVEEEGPVYYEFNEGAITCDKSKDFPKNHLDPCVVGIDWGMHDKTGIVWVHVMPNGELLVSDSHNQNNWGVDRHCAVIKRKNESKYPPKAYVLDATAFSRRGGTQTTVAMEFNKAGVHVIPADMSLDVSIMVLKKFIAGDGERPWIHIDKSCKDLIKGLKDWLYGEHEPDIASALRFAVFHIYKTRMSTLVNVGNMSSGYKCQIKKETVEKQEAHVNRIIRIRESETTSLMWGCDAQWDVDGNSWN